MKKILVLYMFLLFLVQVIVNGQRTVDFVLRARAYAESGNTEKSLNLLNEALSGTKDSRLYIERAEVNMIKGDYSDAIDDLNEANKLNANSGEYGLAKIYALKGDAATALYHLEMHLNSKYKKGEKEVMLEPAFSTIDNSPQWRQFWKNEWYSKIERSISEIEYYLLSGKTEESKEILSELKRSYDTNSEILYAEVMIGLAGGMYTDAIKTAYKLNNDYPDNVKYLKLLARAQNGVTDPAGASNTYSRLISMDNDDAELLLLRAECYRKTGVTDKAMKDIAKYLDFYPESRRAISLAGKLEAESGDNLSALEYFSKNLKLYPNDPQCYVDRANAYFISKSWELASKDYGMSLDLKPSDSDAWLNKGISLLQSGRLDDACHDFRIAYRLGNKRVSDYLSKNCIK